MDKRLWRDGTPPVEIWPALPFLLRPIVVPPPENFGELPKPLQRLMHHLDEKSGLCGIPQRDTPWAGAHAFGAVRPFGQPGSLVLF